jgi:hypothetical protein
MIMFLTILLAAVPVLFLAALAMKSSSPRAGETAPQPKVSLPAPRFFTEEPLAGASRSRLPRELVLSQIERHFRAEQAAAEHFFAVPSEESLYSEPGSPALN